MTPDYLAALIRRHRFTLSDEKATQAEIAIVLTNAQIEHEREKRLGPGDIVDFFFPSDSIALEVKLRQSKMQIYRQLARYAEHEDVKAILLVSNTAMGLPPEINGKPTRMVSLGQGWL